jgi:Ca2+-binding RTX toxin-like protein
MATYLWSTLSNNQTITFDPVTDVLIFDGGMSSRRDLSNYNFGVTGTTFTDLSGKTVTLDGLVLAAVTTSNITFGGSSAGFFVGDLTTGTTDDALGNIINGGAGHDAIFGLGGNDQMFGGDGDDVIFAAGEGNDTVDGGNGIDSYYAYTTTPYGITANLMVGKVFYGAGEVDTLTSIEGIRGTMQDDTFIGNAQVNYFSGRAGDDFIFGGEGSDWAYYADSSALNGIVVNLMPGLAGSGQPGVATDDGFGSQDILYSIENVRGSYFDDHITGTFDDNTLRAEAGNDTLMGGAGNDTLQGGAGDDRIDGESDFSGAYYGGAIGGDFADYSDATSAVTVSLATAIAQNTGGAGVDTLLNIESLLGSGFSDQLTGNSLANVLKGAAGADTLLGGSGDDILEGGDGNDRIDGGVGIDTVSYRLSSGAVTINLSSAGQQNTVSAGLDTLIGIENVDATDFNDIITGTTGANRIGVYAGNDTVNAGAGDDTIVGSLGNDSINGGLGQDTVDYSDALSGVTVNLNLSVTQNTGGGGLDRLAFVENVVGTEFGDVLTGNAGNNVLDGGYGSDTFVGGAGDDTFVGGQGGGVIDPITGSWIPATDADRVSYAGATSGVTVSTGNFGAQTVGGGQGIDTLQDIEQLVGSSYNDVLSGGGYYESQLLDGGLGNDRLAIAGGTGSFGASSFQQVSDTVIGGAGSDTLVLSDGGYFNQGNGITLGLTVTTAQYYSNNFGEGWLTISGIENVVGSNGNDKITGSVGANYMYGGQGNDTLIAGAGIDTLSYTNEGSNIEFIWSGVTVSLAVTTAQNTGMAGGIDTVTGFENLIGSNYDDSLTGSSASNVITGGAGMDTLTGGLGADRFVYRSLGDTNSWSTNEKITDFSSAEGDKIDLSGVAAATGVAFFFNATSSSLTGSGTPGEIVFNPGDPMVSYMPPYLMIDIDGNTMADMIISLTGVTSFSASDLILS